MGRKSHRYRAAHTAHGAIYWTLFMWPLVLGRAVRRLRRRGKRSLGPQRRRWSALFGARATMGPPRMGPPPPPPPPPAPPVWRLEEGGARRQSNGPGMRDPGPGMRDPGARRSDLVVRTRAAAHQVVERPEPNRSEAPRV